MSFDPLSVHQALDAWAAALWRASWQTGVAAAIVVCLCRLVPSIPARFQCWMWRLVMLKFALSFVWSAPVEIPILPAVEPIASVAPSMPAPFDEFPIADAPSDEAPTASRFPGLLIPFGIWAAVVVWQLGRIGLSCRHAQLLRARCHPSDDRRLLEPCAQFSAMLGLASPPSLLETAGAGSPLLVGILRPAIVLPTTTLAQLDAPERSLVLGHELAHVSRRDLFCSLVAAMIRALFFFHPAAWLGERRLALSQEIAADQLAISLQNQSPSHYARLLLAIVGKLGPREAPVAMSMGAAGEAGSLHRRLSALRYIRQTTTRDVLAYGLLIGLVGIVGLVPWSLVAAPPPAAAASVINEAAPIEKPVRMDRPLPIGGGTVSGRYLSFRDGVLKVGVRDERSGVETGREWQVAGDVRVLSHHRAGPRQSTARDAFKQREPGMAIAVTLKNGNVDFIELGRKIEAKPKSAPAEVATPVKKVDAVGAKAKSFRGRFHSFTDRTLKIETNLGELIATAIPAEARLSVWNDAAGRYDAVPGHAALAQAKAGTPVAANVADSGQLTLRLGSRKGKTVGKFVSFTDGRLQITGTNLGERYTKMYGTAVRFSKFRNDVPAFESIDGGEYRLIGMANEVLGRVKAGTIITVHGEGDENATLVQIGVPKQ